jgi:hypothetical protein
MLRWQDRHVEQLRGASKRSLSLSYFLFRKAKVVSPFFPAFGSQRA